jgi:hypothetical protein
MKRLLIFCFPLLTSSLAFSQDYDNRLLKSYSVEELTQIQTETPSDLKALTYGLENACYFSDTPKGKDLAGIKTIKLTGSDVPCYTDLGLKILDQNQYFMIEGTSKMLVVKSKWVLNHELQNKK